MKKLIIGTFIFIVFIFMFICESVYAATPTLDEIVDKFNNCDAVKEYLSRDCVLEATKSENKITISITANDTTQKIDYILSGTILSTDFSEDDFIYRSFG